MLTSASFSRDAHKVRFNMVIDDSLSAKHMVSTSDSRKTGSCEDHLVHAKHSTATIASLRCA